MKKVTAVVSILAIASLWNFSATQSDVVSPTSEALTTASEEVLPTNILSDSSSEPSQSSTDVTTSNNDLMITSLHVGKDLGSGSGMVNDSYPGDRYEGEHTDPTSNDGSPGPVIAGVISGILVLLLVLGCAVCLCCFCRLARRGSNFSMWKHQSNSVVETYSTKIACLELGSEELKYGEGGVNEYYYETLSKHLHLTFRRGFEASGVYATVGPPEERESSLDFSCTDGRWLRTPPNSSMESAATKVTLDRPKRGNVYEKAKFVSQDSRPHSLHDRLEPGCSVICNRGQLEVSNTYETPIDAQRENSVRSKYEVNGDPLAAVERCAQEDMVQQGTVKDGCSLKDRGGCGLLGEEDLQDEGDLQGEGDVGGELILAAEHEAEQGQEGVAQDGTGCGDEMDTQGNGTVPTMMAPAADNDDYITMASVKSYLTATT